MARTLGEIVAALLAERRAEVEARTAELLAEEQIYQDLRRALRRTRSTMTRRLRIKRAEAVQIERETDLLISTLQHHVSILGGALLLVAEFPGQRQILIQRLGDLADHDDAATARRRRAHR